MKKTIFISLIIGIVLAGGVFIVMQIIQTQQSYLKKLAQETVREERSQNEKVEGYTGNVIAGVNSPYLEFNKTDYDKALLSGKIVFLDFYANWCPICRVEAPEIKAGFDGITTDRLIGFRVNFKDSDTDEAEKALAQEFNVPYQHTKIILKDGKETARFSDQWDKDIFLKEITTIIQ